MHTFFFDARGGKWNFGENKDQAHLIYSLPEFDHRFNCACVCMARVDFECVFYPVKKNNCNTNINALIITSTHNFDQEILV